MAVANAGGTVTLSWSASPTAAQRPVLYAVLRRPAGAGALVEVGRTGYVNLVDAMYVDSPPAGTYDYAVRTVVSAFTSADTPTVTVTTLP